METAQDVCTGQPLTFRTSERALRSAAVVWFRPVLASDRTYCTISIDSLVTDHGGALTKGQNRDTPPDMAILAEIRAFCR